MSKKKFGKKLIVAMPEELFKDYQEACEEKYTTMSQEIRTFMLQFIKGYKNGKKIND